MTLATDSSRNGFKRHHDTSAANTALTVSTPVPARNKPFRLLHVIVEYSGTATQAGVTVSINSGAGAAFDTIIFTGSSDAEDTFFLPDGDLFLLHDDIIVVTAPAGGSAIVSTIAITTQEVE